MKPTSQQIKDWWIQTAELDLTGFLKKYDEYGHADLDVMGTAMEALAETPEPHHGTGPEMAIMFYLLGKIARAFGAYAQGQLPSDDTLHDLAVYAMMARMHRWKKYEEESRA